MDKNKAIEELQKLIDKTGSLMTFGTESTDFIQWKQDVNVALEHIFQHKLQRLHTFQTIEYFTPINYVIETPSAHQIKQDFQKGLTEAKKYLESCIKEIETYWEDTDSPSTPSISEPKKPIHSRKIFIVHGHNESIKLKVDGFLNEMDLEPIILHKQPNKGRTIIEKFEDYSDVGFAIVLLTGDDLGGVATESSDKQKKRARQNVILEFGFFLGKLGRHKVCALYEDGVEIPSDYDGVLFVPIDSSEGWKLKVGKELKAAGIDIDLNKAI